MDEQRNDETKPKFDQEEKLTAPSLPETGLLVWLGIGIALTQAGIVSEGVAQVIDDMGNPLVSIGDSHVLLFISTWLFLSLIQSVCRYS